MKLSNKNILITGGAKRVGAEITRYLCRAGARVIAHYHRSVSEASQLQAELQQQGFSCDTVRADLSDLDAVRTMTEEVLRKWDHIDALVCNASLFRRTPFFSVTESEWDTFLTVNLKSHFFLCQMIGREMVARKQGKIVVITDVSAEIPWPGFLPYSITKAGLQHMVKGLARVLAPHIQVNGVAPGTVLPPENASAVDLESYRQQNLLKKIGTPADIAKTVAFLLQNSDFITGTIIPVDGGYRLKGGG